MLVLEMSLEPAGEAHVRTIWQAIADAGISSSMITKPFSPHISLGIIPYARQGNFIPHMETLAVQTAPIAINMSNYGVFTNPGGVVYLGVTVTDTIQQVHHELYQTYKADLDWNTLYVPDKWVPHCTLAFDVSPPKFGETIELCRHFPLPLLTRVDRIGLVESETGDSLLEFPLMG